MILSSFEKWSNYVHSCISGTHGVKVTPFWAGTKALIPGQCGQPLRNETERSRITYSRLPITRTFMGNRKKFELSGVQVTDHRGGSRERVQGVRTPPKMSCGFLIQLILHPLLKKILDPPLDQQFEENSGSKEKNSF